LFRDEGQDTIPRLGAEALTHRGKVLQALLAILIAVTQGAGPWVRCCCVAPRLAAVVNSFVGPESSACPLCRSAEHARSGCCRSPLGPEGPSRSPEAPDCCPFSGRVMDAVPPTASAGPTADAGPVLPVTGFSTPDRAPALVALEFATDGLPFLTAQAKLYNHHVLRC
jgi:hypothetical protein